MRLAAPFDASSAGEGCSALGAQDASLRRWSTAADEQGTRHAYFDCVVRSPGPLETVVWSRGGAPHVRFTVSENAVFLDACFCHLGADRRRALCVLTTGQLHVVTEAGESTVAVPCTHSCREESGSARLLPTSAGVAVVVRGEPLMMLSDPMEGVGAVTTHGERCGEGGDHPMDGQGVHLSWLWADERFPWVLSFDPAKKRHQLWAIVPGAPEGAGHTQAVAAPMEAGPSRATGAVAFRTPKGAKRHVDAFGDASPPSVLPAAAADRTDNRMSERRRKSGIGGGRVGAVTTPATAAAPSRGAAVTPSQESAMDIGDDPRPVDGIDAILSGLMGQLPKAQTPLTSVGDGTDTLARAPPRWRLESVWQEGAEGDAVGGTPADDVSVATDVDGAPLVCLTNARAHRGALVRVDSDDVIRGRPAVGSLLCVLPATAAASVLSCVRRCQAQPTFGSMPVTDLVVLTPAGSMEMYVGASRVACVPLAKLAEGLNQPSHSPPRPTAGPRLSPSCGSVTSMSISEGDSDEDNMAEDNHRKAGVASVTPASHPIEASPSESPASVAGGLSLVSVGPRRLLLAKSQAGFKWWTRLSSQVLEVAPEVENEVQEDIVCTLGNVAAWGFLGQEAALAARSLHSVAAGALLSSNSFLRVLGDSARVGTAGASRSAVSQELGTALAAAVGAPSTAVWRPSPSATGLTAWERMAGNARLVGESNPMDHKGDGSCLQLNVPHLVVVVQALHALREAYGVGALTFQRGEAVGRYLCWLFDSCGLGMLGDAYESLTQGSQAGAADSYLPLAAVRAEQGSLLTAMRLCLRGDDGWSAHLPALLRLCLDPLANAGQRLERGWPPALALAARLAKAHQELYNGGALIVSKLRRTAKEVASGAETPSSPGGYVEALSRSLRVADTRLVAHLIREGWSPTDLNALAPGATLPLLDSFQRLSAKPPHNLDPAAYVLMQREDVAATVWAEASGSALGSEAGTVDGLTLDKGGRAAPEDALVVVHALQAWASPALFDVAAALGRAGAPGTVSMGVNEARHAPSLTGGHVSGTEGLDSLLFRMRFPSDARLGEACSLLDSSKPRDIRPPRAGSRTGEASRDIQLCLWAMSRRTLALPVGRGALTLHTAAASSSEPLPVPELVISGRLPSQKGAVVALDIHAPSMVNNLPASDSVAAYLTDWPLFHNGCAAGLRVRPGNADAASRAWVAYHAPREPTSGHAGLLFAMGLSGHLAALSMPDLYELLRWEHVPTTAAVLLGTAAAKRGSMDPAASRMMFLHSPAQQTEGFPDIEVHPLVQSCALLGVGLLYQGTGHRLVVEQMLSAIRPPPWEPHLAGPANGVPVDGREAYALCGGFALGLVVLGMGRETPGLSDLRLDEQLGAMVNVGIQEAPPDARARPRASSTTFVGSLPDIDVVSPAATVAMALAFLGTNDTAAAAQLALPSRPYLLRVIRPDHAMLRATARCLVLWDSVGTSHAWLQNQMPEFLRGSLPDLVKEWAALPVGDGQSRASAHVHLLAGLALGMGLRYAGTQDSSAASTLLDLAEKLLALKASLPEPGPGRAPRQLVSKQDLESALCTVMQSACCVLAGSGDVRAMRLVRALLRRRHMSVLPGAGAEGPILVRGTLGYGNSMAASQALGLLFLSGGTGSLSNAPSAVAYLFMALYPNYAWDPADNRHIPQLLRHMYVLASEPRALVAIDVESGALVRVPVRVAFTQHDKSGDGDLRLSRVSEPRDTVERLFMAPLLLPPVSACARITVCGLRYHGYSLEGDAIRAVSKRGALFVKRRPAALPYSEDPNGVRSILASANAPPRLSVCLSECLGPQAALAGCVGLVTSQKSLMGFGASVESGALVAKLSGNGAGGLTTLTQSLARSPSLRALATLGPSQAALAEPLFECLSRGIPQAKPALAAAAQAAAAFLQGEVAPFWALATVALARAWHEGPHLAAAHAVRSAEGSAPLGARVWDSQGSLPPGIASSTDGAAEELGDVLAQETGMPQFRPLMPRAVAEAVVAIAAETWEKGGVRARALAWARGNGHGDAAVRALGVLEGWPRPSDVAFAGLRGGPGLLSQLRERAPLCPGGVLEAFGARDLPGRGG